MSREIVVSEAEKLAVVVENGEVREFYLSEGEQYVGDIILATVESIVPAIEAAFLNIGREKSGFIHVSDLPSSRKQQSGIRQYLKPQQQMLVQVTREPTGNKGACLTGFIQLPGRFLVLTPFERRIGLSKRIYDARERARLARIARMICGSGYGIVLRPEAVGQSEQTLRDDLKLLMGRWKHILASSDKQQAGTTLYRDQDILERILREGATSSVNQIIVDNQGTYDRAVKYFSNWSETKARTKLRVYNGDIPMLAHYGVYQQLEKAIQPLVQLPSGGTLVIQPTEALTSIDINTSSMTSTDNQPETILRTNCEAAEEIARQLVLRDIGGVIVIDFIDMDNPRDQQIVWQALADKLQHDKAQPQISYFSEFGLVEMTRRRQRQRLSEMMTIPCPTCQGIGRIRNTFYRYDILSQSGVKMRTPVLQPEEKSVRYQDGQEKQSSRRRGGSNEDSGRSNNRNNGSGKSKRSERSKAQANEPAPKEEKTTQRNAKAAAPEKPEDLLFDDSIFTSSITDEVLEAYIEREDKLNVSSRLASNLDNLISRIDDDGIESIKRNRQAETESTSKKRKKVEEEPEAEVFSETDMGDLDSYIESEGVSDAAEVDAASDDSPEEAEKVEESEDTAAAEKEEKPVEAEAESDEPEVVAEKEEKPAKKTKAKATKTTTKKTTKKRTTKKKAEAAEETAKAETVEADEKPAEKPEAEAPEVESADEVKAETPETEVIENDEVVDAATEEGDDEYAMHSSSVSSASLAESALSTSSRTRSAFTKPKTTAKRPLTRRRTIRSFRPKR